MQIDINCDLGEGVNIDDCARDTVLMGLISRRNIACGDHAGDDTTMALTAPNALQYNLAIGAHRGYPDRENFGWKSLSLPEKVLLESVAKQIATLCRQQTMCLIKGETLSSIEGKPLAFAVENICLHGDNPQPVPIASQLQQALYEADIRIDV